MQGERAWLERAERLEEEEEEWMRAYKQLKTWEEIVISSDDEEELSRQNTVSSACGLSSLKTGRPLSRLLRGSFLSLERGRQKMLKCELT